MDQKESTPQIVEERLLKIIFLVKFDAKIGFRVEKNSTTFEFYNQRNLCRIDHFETERSFSSSIDYFWQN